MPPSLPLGGTIFMSEFVYINGMPRPKWAVELVDNFLTKVKSRPMWEMIDFLVSVYLKKHPEFITPTNARLKNSFAATKDKSMRHLLSIPMDLKDTIDWFYGDDIKAMGPVKFWRKFAKKYPVLTMAKSI